MKHVLKQMQYRFVVIYWTLSMLSLKSSRLLGLLEESAFVPDCKTLLWRKVHAFKCIRVVLFGKSLHTFNRKLSFSALKSEISCTSLRNTTATGGSGGRSVKAVISGSSRPPPSWSSSYSSRRPSARGPKSSLSGIRTNQCIYWNFVPTISILSLIQQIKYGRQEIGLP